MAWQPWAQPLDVVLLLDVHKMEGEDHLKSGRMLLLPLSFQLLDHHLGDSNRHSKNNRGILETSRLHVMNIFLVKCILLKLLWLCCLAMDFAHTSWQSSTQRKCRQPSAILKLSDSGFHLPSGKLTVCYGKIHHFQLVNPRTKWPFSIAM